MSKNDSAKTLDINVSTGLMYETEEYAVDNGKVNKYLWRSTSFVSIDWLIKEKLNLTGVVYFQPAFKKLSNYRIASDLGFEVAIAKSLHFVTQISLRYNNIPITDVKKYDFSIQNGLRVEIR
jgi:putative salt-induced outer membrane protein YdiY